MLGYAHKYYRKNKDSILKRGIEWRLKNPKKVQEIQYRVNHSDKGKQRQKRYRDSHKKERSESFKKWYEKNKERMNELHRLWVSKNKESARQIDRKQYARRKKAKGNFTLKEWEEVKKKHGYRCAICKKMKKLTVDHIIPLSKNGTNYIQNIQSLCKNCNSSKNNKLLE